MLVSEAEWLGKALSVLPLAEVSPCLNLGSSTVDFRTVIQPHIRDQIIAPNEARGVSFIHADEKDAPGVDVVGDIFDPECQALLESIRPASILCCNMFEHVTDRSALVAVCKRIVRPGGYVIVSVPFSYPYHADPIDTYFRPDPDELMALFTGCERISSGIVSDQSYWQEFLHNNRKYRLLKLLKLILRLCVPLYKWESWKHKAHSVFWLCRPYKVSVVVLKVRGG